MTDEITTEVRGDSLIVNYPETNQLDFDNIQQTSAHLDGVLETCEQSVMILNFNGMKFYNSISLGFLASKNKKVREAGKDLRLCNLSDESRWSIGAAQLDRILSIFPDVEAALAG